MIGISEPGSLDAVHYDPIDHLNLLFSTPAALSAIGPVSTTLCTRKHDIDNDISTLEAAQAYGATSSLSRMTDAQSELASVFTKINEVKGQAVQTEDNITAMTADIKRLDGTKKNLTKSMTALKRLQMLTTAYEQLRGLARARQYRDCAGLLQAVLQLMKHFNSYRSIEQIAKLSKGVAELQRELLEQICEDFEVAFAKEEISLQKATLIEACLVMDALGEAAKARLMTWYINTELREYRQVFRGSDEAGSLDNIGRRYAWFKRTMKRYEDEHAVLFPTHWRMGEALTTAFCDGTREDFLSLQEISVEAFKEDFSPRLAKLDYKGVQWPKSRARTMSEKDAAGVDGCAVFWKNSKFILLDKQLIEFATIAINRPDMRDQHDVFNRVMPRDNIAVICFLESRLTGARIILVNVHLTWDTALADVKVIQTGIMMEHVTKIAEKYARWPALKDKKMIKPPRDLSDPYEPPAPIDPAPSQEYRNNVDIPLIVCGDFNSLVGSSVYDLMSLGRVEPTHEELSNHQYGNFTRLGIQHPFTLRDAYTHLKGTPDEMAFTNYTPGFSDVIDYLWYSTNTLEVVELLGPPDRDALRRIPAFPAYHFPADHIQIMSEFVIKARKDKKNQDGEVRSEGRADVRS